MKNFTLQSFFQHNVTKSLTNFLPSAASLIDNIDVVEENMTLIVNEIAKRENWKID